MTEKPRGKPGGTDEGLAASVQILPLPPGLYLFSVKAAKPFRAVTAAYLTLPAVHVGLGPGVRADQVEFIGGPGLQGTWLFSVGDQLVARVQSSGATLVLTSMRTPGGDLLSIAVERLDGRAAPGSNERAVPASMLARNEIPAAANPPAQSGAVDAEPDASGSLPLEVNVHVRTRGDLTYGAGLWAGRVAPGLWIESFSLKPLERIAPSEVEYKGLTGSGFETPWLNDEKMCGTKGMSVPLVGFAIRLRPSPVTSEYDCEYSGFFKSGLITGPLRNGAPCRSTVANDPLEGIQVRIVRRLAAGMAAPTSHPESRSDVPAGNGSDGHGPLHSRKPRDPAARNKSARNARRAQRAS